MPRHMVPAIVVVLAVSATLRADDDAFREEFRRAELEETAFGDLKDAAAIYRAAAGKAADAASRSRAELRAGSCLRRLGQMDDARALLAPLAGADDVPDDVRRAAKAELEAAAIAVPPPALPQPGPTGDRRRLADAEREREEMRAQLEAALQRAEGLDKEKEDLAQKLLEKDKEIRAMRAEISPETAEEALRGRLEEQERRRQLSRNFASFARRLHQEGRFADAREFLDAALEKDPENAEAKALVTLVSAPLGVRERLYESVVAVLALAGEVRGARTAAEIESLVAEARRRQGRDEFAQSVAPLETALALIEADSVHLHDAAAQRESVLTLLRSAQARGAQRAPVAAPPRADTSVDRGLAAVRELLTEAGAEVARGLDLRFHDAGPPLAAAQAGLPPSPLGAAPEGWTISSGDGAAAPLLAEYLRAADAEGFAAPGAGVEAQGATVVAICNSAAQARLLDRMTRLADVTAPAAEVRIAAYRVPPGFLATILERRGVRSAEAAGGARAAPLSASEFPVVAAELGKRADAWPSEAALRATTLRPFRMVAGTTSASLSIDVLPVTRPDAGVALRVTTEWSPAGRSDGARLRQETTSGALADAGGGVVVFGLADPADPSRDLAVLVRQGVASEGTVAAPPRPAEPLGSAEMLLPASLRGITEVGTAAIVVPSHPVPSRDQALAARIRAVARSAQSVEVKGDRVRVVGPDDARAAARKFLDQVDVVRGVQEFDVAMYEITQAAEDSLLAALPRIERRQGDSFARAVARPDERVNVERALVGTRGRVPLLDSRLSMPPTGRDDAAYVVRSSYRRDLDVAPGAEPSWGRSETSVADRGVLVAIRPFGRRETGRVDLDVSMRAASIADRGPRVRRTPLGEVDVLEPTVANWWGDVSLTLADDELLVLAGLENPLADGRERPRLVITVAVARR